MGKASFLDNFQASYDGLERERYEQIAHAVLYHLWRRLPFDERERLQNTLPDGLRELLNAPKNSNEPETTTEQRFKAGPIETDDIRGFLDQIRNEAGLGEDNKDQEAVRAVFEALKAELPADEVVHIQEVLPTGVKPMWAGA